MRAQSDIRRAFPAILAAALGLLTLLSVLLSIRGDSAIPRSERVRPVSLRGAYSLNGAAFAPLTPETTFGVSAYNTVVIRGHFSREIPKNEQLLLHLPHLRVELRRAGELLFSNASALNRYARTPGNYWAAVVSPGIAASDEIELTVSNVYTNGNRQSFSQLLNGMYAGYEGDIARFIISRHLPYILLGMLTIPPGLLLLAVAFILRQINRTRAISLALFSVSMGLWLLLEPMYISFIVYSPQTVYTIFQSVQLLQLLSITLFVQTIVGGARKKAVGILLFITVCLYAGATVLQLMRVRDYYDSSLINIVLCCLLCVVLPAAVLAEAFQGSALAKQTLPSMLILTLCTLGNMLLCGLNLLANDWLLMLGFLLFLSIQAFYRLREARAFVDQLARARKLESELLESRTAIMLSQIQPHFLYNALGTIKFLCRKDPRLAEQATEDFAEFLRGNMNSLRADKPIAFEDELEHTKRYLSLEKLRFEENLRVVYDLRATLFRLPTLSLQPLVENAVRRGVTKREEGGTVAISSRETASAFVVTVADDGVGFDAGGARGDGQSHLGIENVRDRLEKMCGGSLIIESLPGVGTTATIIIPKEAPKC